VLCCAYNVVLCPLSCVIVCMCGGGQVKAKQSRNAAQINRNAFCI